MKDANKIKNNLKVRRVVRVRAKISGTAARPRIAVFKSSKHLSVQAINDQSSKTLASSTDKEIKAKTKMEMAKSLGEALAKKLLAAGVKQCVFDKRHYKYHGLIKELADGLRAGGLEF